MAFSGIAPTPTVGEEGPAPLGIRAGMALTGAGNLQLIVELTQPSVLESLAQGRGRVADAGTAAEGPAARMDLRSTEAASYQTQVRNAQKLIAERLGGVEGARVLASLDLVLDAVIVEVPADQYAVVRRLQGVKRIYLSRDRKLALDASAALQNAQGAWDRMGGRDGAGRGVKIGIIDSGIDATHPMFSVASVSPPAGYPRGETAFTNGKVIVARSYVGLLRNRQNIQTAVDEVGHGTFVAGCAAGNRVNAPLASISGMAPGAYLGNYKVFGSPDVNDTTTSAAILAALNDAVGDGMDVLNLSLGSLSYVPASEDPEVRAIENAIAAGVTVVMAAGNEGPDANTVSNPGNAVNAITVGAVSNSRLFASQLRVVAPAPVPADLQGIPYLPGDGPVLTAKMPATGIVDVSTLDGSGLACAALPAQSLSGKIALLSRGNCTFAAKVANAAAAGAAAVLVYNNVSSAPAISMGGLSSTIIPAVMISNDEGLLLKSYVAANGSAVRVEIDAASALSPKAVAPGVITDFSSIGPTVEFNLKPDLVAVGQDVYSAAQNLYPAGGLYSSTRFAVASGTSFSAPMVAGAAAVLRQLYPTLTPLALKSLLVNTAARDLSASGTGTAGVLQVGGGLLDMGNAAAAGAFFTPASISFGASSFTGNIVLVRTLTIHNAASTADRFVLSAEPVVSGPGITLSSAGTGTLAAGGAWSVDVTLQAKAPMTGGFQGFVKVESARSGAVYRIPYWAGLYVPDTSTVLRVRQSPGVGEHASLALALKAARPGNVIEFQDSGTYAGGWTLRANSEGLPLDGITIRAAQGQTPVLDGTESDTGAGLWIIGLQNVLVQGLTIKGGDAAIVLTQPLASMPLSVAIDRCTLSPAAGGNSSDGIVIESGGTVDVAQSVLNGFSGSGINAAGGAWISLSGCTLQGNGSCGIEASDCGVTILNSTMSGNSGPGAYLDNCSGSVEGNTFSRNTGSYGDGVEIVDGSLVLRNNTFESNERAGVGLFGGAVSGLGPKVTLAGNIIRSNPRYGLLSNPALELTLDGNFLADNGRGLRLIGSTAALLVNNIVVRSTDSVEGDGLQAAGDSSVRLVNNTFFKNKLHGISLASPARISVANCILSGNGGGDLMGLQSTDVRYSLIGDGSVSGGNNLAGDPKFLDPESDRFEPSPGSPAIDAGSNSVADLPFLDYGRRLRVASSASLGMLLGDGLVDMGAVEAGASFPLVFPLLANNSGPSPFGDLTTGFAVLNTSALSTEVGFEAFGQAGGLIPGSSNPSVRSISSEAQVPILGFQLFGLNFDGSSPGAVMGSAAQKIAGFFLVFDRNFRRVADGVDVSGTAGTDIIFMRHVSDSSGKSVYAVFNPGVNPAGISAALLNFNGTLVGAPQSAVLPAKGSTLLAFDSLTASSGYVRLKSDRPISGLELFGNNFEMAALGAASPGADARLFFPHIAINQGFSTTLGVVNSGPLQATLALKLFGDDGTCRLPAVTRVLEANGQLFESVTSLFGLGSGDMFTGYVVVESDRPGILGFSNFRYDDGAVQSMTAVPAQGTPRQKLLFSHVAHQVPAGSGGTYQTGIALLNPYGLPVNYSLKVFNGEGIQVAEKTGVLDSRAKFARILSHPVPGAGIFTQPLPLGSGHIEVTSDRELLGFELFFTEDFSQLAAVTAQ